MLTCFERRATLSSSLTRRSTIVHNGTGKNCLYRNQECGILSLGTCIADYHLFSRLADMPNHHQSSSLHFCPAGMLLSDTEKLLGSANRILKTLVLLSYSWLPVQRLSQANN